MPTLVIRNLDAPLTLMDSAQTFHWTRTGDALRGVCAGREATVCACADGALVECAEGEEAFWRAYFDAERDYGALLTLAKPYPKALCAVERYAGLRVLRQPPWEALVAFILSANNNVTRIRGLARSVCERFGENGGYPSPERLAEAGERALRDIGCGYRAPYLAAASRLVADGFPLDALAELPYEEAKKRLICLPGVGSKVADCVLLFGCGHTEAFPVDVWVERLMREWFCPEASGKQEIRARAQAMFGSSAGLIQQFLFHAARTGGMGERLGSAPRPAKGLTPSGHPSSLRRERTGNENL